MKHRPHDTRHTCISMLTVAGVSDKVIQKIVGHKGQGVTEVVYTHFEIEIYPQFRSMDEVPPEGRTIKKDNNKAQKNLNDKNCLLYTSSGASAF